MFFKNNKKKSNKFKEKYLLSEKTPFAIQEAYKTLRTNILFSMPDTDCKIIIVTSAIEDQGKSITSINLAIALAQNKERVVLLECDLRRPVVAKRLNVAEKTGLTDWLVGKATSDEILHKDERGFYVITAGSVPPDPTELLGSKKMKKFLEVLKDHFDYIIVDTPPVNVVSDALILSKLANGVVFTVRQNDVLKEEIHESLHQLTFVGAKILGFIMTGVRDDKLRIYHGGKNYYHKYYGNKENT